MGPSILFGQEALACKGRYLGPRGNTRLSPEPIHRDSAELISYTRHRVAELPWGLWLSVGRWALPSHPNSEVPEVSPETSRGMARTVTREPQESPTKSYLFLM